MAKPKEEGFIFCTGLPKAKQGDVQTQKYKTKRNDIIPENDLEDESRDSGFSEHAGVCTGRCEIIWASHGWRSDASLR